MWNRQVLSHDLKNETIILDCKSRESTQEEVVTSTEKGESAV